MGEGAETVSTEWRRRCQPNAVVGRTAWAGAIRNHCMQHALGGEDSAPHATHRTAGAPTVEGSHDGRRGGRPVQDQRGTIRTRSRCAVLRAPSATRPWSFPSTLFSATRGSWLASPRTRTSARGFSRRARGKETPPVPQPSAGHSNPTPKSPTSISPHTTTKKYPKYTPSRSRNCRTARTEAIENTLQFSTTLCLRPMPTVGIIVGTGVGTPRRHRPPREKITRRETAGRVPRLACAVGRSARGSHRSDDAANCAAWLGRGRGRDGAARSGRRV